MNVSLFIARRTAGEGPAATERIAAAAVAVSIAVMILTLAVISGFRREITAAVEGMVSAVTVTDVRSLAGSGETAVHDDSAVRSLILSTPGVRSTSVYALRGGAIRSKGGVAGTAVKGIAEESDLSFLERGLRSGALPRLTGDRRKEVLLTAACAAELGVAVGDRVELLFTDGGQLRREMMSVCGTCEAGLGEGGVQPAWTDIRNIRKINGWDDSLVSGWEVAVADFDRADAVADAINDRLAADYGGEDNLVAASARRQYAHIFGWLSTHDVNAAVIITIMLVVALFNMITALLILVLERTRTIGVLKSMGMSNGRIRSLFVWRAGFLAVRGLVWGNAAGIGLAALQMWTHAVKLDARGYFVSAVPVSLDAGRIVLLDVLFAAAIVAALAAAATIVSRIRPAEAMRYE